MNAALRAGVMALAAIATMAASASPHRLIIVVAQPDDPRAVQQHAALEQAGPALQERDVVVQDMTPQTARRERPDFGVRAQTTFEVLLVGKDGGVKLRRDAPVAASEMTALIDTMPMRRAEMGR